MSISKFYTQMKSDGMVDTMPKGKRRKNKGVKSAYKRFKCFQAEVRAEYRNMEH